MVSFHRPAPDSCIRPEISSTVSANAHLNIVPGNDIEKRGWRNVFIQRTLIEGIFNTSKLYIFMRNKMAVSKSKTKISGIVKLERLAYVLKSLNNEELETLELLLDNDASQQIFSSIKELKAGKGVPIEQW
jgi:hypothetical protein